MPRRGGRLLVQLVVRLVLRSSSTSLVFATIAAVPRPRGFPYILACFHVQRHCQKAYSDCSIVAARTRFLSSHTVSSPNQLDRAARAWCVALKYAPRPRGEGEGTRAPRAARAWDRPGKRLYCGLLLAGGAATEGLPEVLDLVLVGSLEAVTEPWLG